jgi:hypothetical protein
MLMRSVTLQVENRRQTAVRRASHTPWLVDVLSFHRTKLCNKTIHAPVKLSEDKTVLENETANSFVLPALAASGPFNKDTSTIRQRLPSERLKSTPKTLE